MSKKAPAISCLQPEMVDTESGYYDHPAGPAKGKHSQSVVLWHDMQTGSKLKG